MARWALLLTTFAACAAWAGGQGPRPAAPLSADDQLRLFKANARVIDILVDQGVGLSAGGSVEARAAQCQAAARALAGAIHDAAQKQNAERVAELTPLFRDVVRDALLPTLLVDGATVPFESPAGRKLREVKRLAADDVRTLKAALPEVTKLAGTPRGREALDELEKLDEKLR